MSVYNIGRFIAKQEEFYDIAYKELENGKKESHWMWYIFPQLRGLGKSERSFDYGIKDKNEAIEYLENNYLYNNLVNICRLLLKLPEKDPVKIFGYTDSLKLKSCLTLFKYVVEKESFTKLDCGVFRKALDRFYKGEQCNITLKLLDEE